ncbi:glycosyl hydrolase family 95 catalytic domain-containing protein [Mucilaginibacter arboris]|uniref:Alpha-L-fucosidase n=1 Tax=Mucilaginibacter arboris TaxID=2682090 RepID=A0A7K1T1A9_9SPHI|nr:glycoside hydrolase N-terminal domain-containing protein [Mucilaginibacter arboris]MVN23080.1 alpha-L-fucosidase [Mucilaginibacter arboris]
MKKKFILFAVILPVLTTLKSFAQDNYFQVPKRGVTSWQPAANWEHSLLTGNGTMGALVIGQPHDETIILSHALLYLPQKRSGKDFEQAGKLTEIRQLIQEGKFTEASQVPVKLREEQGYADQRDPFIPAFQIKVEQQPSNIKRYQRSTNFETGEAIVDWQDELGTFERKVFVSRADSLVVLSIKGTGKINCSMNFEHVPIEWNQWKFVNENVGEMKAGAEGQWLTYQSSFKNHNPGGLQGYEGAGRLILKGGSSKVENGKLMITNADEVLLLTKIMPSYHYESSNLPLLKQQLEAKNTDYQAMLLLHTKIHGELFNRMKLDLNATAQQRALNNEEMLLQVKKEPAAAQIERAFDAGRYNIISSMGTNPPNLQGLWSGNWSSPWTGGFTTDGNLPTAVSIALPGNMPELMKAYFSYHEKLMDDFRKEAKLLYNCRGIHIPAQITTTGVETDFGGTWCLTFWTGAAGWTAHYFYDYWLYTGDQDFLKNHAYPFMKEAALFYEDFLKTGKDGKYLFNPSYSPENNPANSPSQATLNATMDVMIAKQLLRNCINAAKALKTDQAKIAQWKNMLAKMPAYEINKDGALQEWCTPDLQDNYSHRHSSHLYALYDEVDPDFANNPKLTAAANVAIEKRMKFRIDEGGGEMAFGLVQLALASAHIGQAEKAQQIVEWLSSKYWTTGMGSFHNVGGLFNTDISGGLPYVITQMLTYADPGKIALLPALPKEWTKGKIEGVLLRGQVEVKSLTWDGKHVEAVLQSQMNQKVELQLPGLIEKLGGETQLRAYPAHPGSYQLTLPALQEVHLILDLK